MSSKIHNCNYKFKLNLPNNAIIFKWNLVLGNKTRNNNDRLQNIYLNELVRETAENWLSNKSKGTIIISIRAKLN